MKDIEPIHALAISMQARPKLYALLLGSGVSKAAGIPTGWEVVLDLVSKLARMSGEEPEDPCQWYKDKYGTEPNYSELLELIAPTSAGRQQLQRQYWEGDSPDATKQPTAAHKAIADLVKRGFVKVIITTNFDRLVENALREVGVEPMVLRSSDDVAGMTPLDHINCCVLKLHGDYMDERVRNTTDELAKYPDVVSQLINRIFDEYGLVICGWSGEWDVALSGALRRASPRRYTSYWAAHDGLGDDAKHIVATRDARVIEIESADRFFGNLSSLVTSLTEYTEPHPLSVRATVAQCKQFLAQGRHQIELVDLIDSIGREALNDLAELPELESTDGDALTDRVRRYENICSKLLPTAVTAAYWSDATQIDAWRNTVELLFQDTMDAGRSDALLSTYPAVLLTYALGIGAVAHGRLDCLGRILEFPTGRDIEKWRGQTVVRRDGEVADDLSDTILKFVRSKESMQKLKGMDLRHVPVSDWLFQSLRSHTTALIRSETRYEHLFDRLEVLLALGCGLRMNENRQEHPWFPFGCFIYRNLTFQSTVREVEESINRDGNDSPFVRHKLVGDRAEDALANLKSFCDFVSSVRNNLHIFML